MTTPRHAESAGLLPLLITMCTALALVIGAASSLSLALPEIAEAARATQTELTWVVNVYALVFAALLLPIGIAADRWGRRQFLVAGLALFAAASVTSGLVDQPELIIVLRGIAGVGAAAVMPATLSVLVDAFPDDRRSQAVAIWAAVSGAGAMVGILASGLLVENFWWGSVQVVYGAAAAIVALVCLTNVPTSRNPELRMDPAGSLLSVAGLSALVFGLIEGPERGWAAPVTLTAIALGFGLLVGFVVHELRTSHPMLEVRLFRSAGLSTGSVMVFLQFFATFGFFFLAPQWLQYVHRLGPLETALWLTALTGGIAPAARVGPQLVIRFGSAPVGAWGMAQMAVAFVMFALLKDGDTSLWMFALALVVLGFGFGLAINPGTTLIIDGLPEDRRTLAAAVNDVTRELGGALGGAVAASVLLAVYGDQVLAGVTGVPEPAAQASEEGVAQAVEAAAQLDREQGIPLVRSAVEAFANGYAAAMWVGAATLLLGAFVVAVAGRQRRSATSPDRDDRVEDPDQLTASR